MIPDHFKVVTLGPMPEGVSHPNMIHLTDDPHDEILLGVAMRLRPDAIVIFREEKTND